MSRAKVRQDKCRSCRRPIVWLRTGKGSAMPVNAETARPTDYLFDKAKGHVSHFADCPDAKQHRTQQKGTPDVTDTPAPRQPDDDACRTLGAPDGCGDDPGSCRLGGMGPGPGTAASGAAVYPEGPDRRAMARRLLDGVVILHPVRLHDPGCVRAGVAYTDGRGTVRLVTRVYPAIGQCRFVTLAGKPAPQEWFVGSHGGWIVTFAIWATDVAGWLTD